MWFVYGILVGSTLTVALLMLSSKERRILLKDKKNREREMYYNRGYCVGYGDGYNEGEEDSRKKGLKVNRRLLRYNKSLADIIDSRSGYAYAEEVYDDDRLTVQRVRREKTALPR